MYAYNHKNINTNTWFQNSNSYICTYPLHKHRHKQKHLFPKCQVLHVYILSQPTNITSITCVHTLYNNTNINTNTCCQNYQSYMYTYPLQQQKRKHKESMPYMPSITCVHTLYSITNINIRVHFQNYQSYICTYHLQQHKHKHKLSFFIHV